jgi:hypothetical protein
MGFFQYRAAGMRYLELSKNTSIFAVFHYLIIGNKKSPQLRIFVTGKNSLLRVVHMRVEPSCFYCADYLDVYIEMENNISDIDI